jgi:hypothetical protein
MPEVTDGSPPVVRAPTGFHGDDAARLLGKEGENFFSGELFAEANAAVGKGAMRLEGPLCKIETDNASVMGLWASSPSSEYRAAGFMLPSVVDTRPPHHAVRQRTSGPI